MNQDSLNKIQSITSIVSAIAIPLVIAIVGWSVQSTMKAEDIKKEYVSMALEIMKDPERSSDDALRKWAISILDKSSPVPFSRELRDRLESGEVRLRFYFPMPPKILMDPPKGLKTLPETGDVTIGDLLVNVVDNYGICTENAYLLDSLQEWTRDMKRVSLGEEMEFLSKKLKPTTDTPTE